MECTTFSHIDNGNKVYKPKIQFTTLELAITECKKINKSIKQINKVVSYKCNNCHKFHIGRNGKPLQKKYY
jgi:predicted RNA-binding Zn-ribbon protein involved in translation (DUF1610 family)